MKTPFLPLVSLSSLFFVHTAFAMYIDGSGTVPSAMSGFVAASGDVFRGNVLSFSGGETWEVSSVASGNPVVSFIAKGSGALNVAGVTNVIINSESWQRHVISVGSVSSVAFSASGEFQLDDFYVGRQLSNSLQETQDILSCQSDEDGILSSMPDGGFSGMWESVTDRYGNRWTSDANGLKAEISTSYAGLTNVCRQIVPLASPLSDNIVVSFEVQKQSRLYNRPDSLFVAVSTNDCVSFSEWQSAAIPLCEPFLVSFDSETDIAAGGWVSCAYGLEIKGLKDLPSVQLGFLTVAGRSGEFVYVRNISVTYKTRVTGKNAGIEAGNNTGILPYDSLRYEQDGHARVDINSTSDSTNITVIVDHFRTHFGTRAYTNSYDFPVSSWIGPYALSSGWGHPLEAGETNVFTVITSYSSSQGLDDSNSPETNSFTFVVGGLGSVWLNEIDAANGKVELAGPVGRHIDGWKLRVKDGANLATGLSGTLANPERGMAFLVLDNLSLSSLSGTKALELVNAAGIVEATTAEIDFTENKLWVATGRLPYIEDGAVGDWTDASANFATFVPEASADATWGGMNTNVGQSADQPVRLAVEFRSRNQNNLLVQSFNPGFTGNPDLALSFSISDANPLLERIAAITNEFGDVVAEQTNTWHLAEEPPVELAGMASATTNVWYCHTAFLDAPIAGTNDSWTVAAEDVETLATAFGFYGETEIEGGELALDAPDSEAVTTNVVYFLMSPSVGEENFDTDFRDGRWVLETEMTTGWDYLPGGGEEGNVDGCARAAIASSWKDYAARMRTIDSVSRLLEGSVRSYMKFSAKVKNTMAPSGREDKLAAILRDPLDNGVIVAVSNANNRQTLYSNNAWVSFDQIARIPDGTPEKVVFEMAGVAGRSGVYFDFDDVYLSFQDWAGVTNCLLTPAVPQAGKALSADATLVGGAGGASNVVVSLVATLTRNRMSTCYTNEVARYDWLDEGESTLHIDDVLAFSGLGDSFLEGDEFRFYFLTQYDTRNGAQQPEYQRDTDYYPGSNTGSMADASWVAVGGYGPADSVNLLGGTAWGVQEVWVNEVHLAGSSSWVELCGLTNAILQGWILEVRDTTGALVSSTPVPVGWAWANTEENPGYGFYVFENLSLDATGGGLRVIDAERQVRYALSFNCSIPGYERLGGTENPVAAQTGSSLAAIGVGNPANVAFTEWEVQQGDGTYAARNGNGQSLENSGPITPVFWATPVEGTTSVRLTAQASDMDKPVQYRLSGPGVAGEGEWVNEAGSVSYTWEIAGLGENSLNEWTVETRDALGNNGAGTNVVCYTLVTNWTASACGVATDAIELEASIPNQSAGDTAWTYDGWHTTNITKTLRVDSLLGGPNVYHKFNLLARNGDGVESTVTNIVTAYTMAAAPGAAPAIVKNKRDVTLSLPEDDADYLNGNPDGTLFAVCATLWKKDAAGPTNVYWNAGANGEVARTLPNWRTVMATTPWADDITPTNIVFSLVAINGDGVETPSEFSAETHFELTVTTRSIEQPRDGTGLVAITADILNPFQNDITSLSLEWSADGETWSPATLTSATAAYGQCALANGVVSGIPTDNESTNAVSLVWNARQNLGQVDVSNVRLRWDAETENTTLVDSESGTSPICLALPGVTNIVFAGSLQNRKAKNAATLPFTVMFDDAVSNLTKTAITVSGGSVQSVTASTGLSSTWTVQVEPSDRNTNDLVVAITDISEGAALDNFGNRSQAWSGNASVAYDGKAPTVSLSGTTTPFKASDVPWVVTATFSEPVYGVSKDDLTVQNGNATLVSGADGDTVFTFNVTPATDGAVKVTFKANAATDAAGNANTASAQLSRTYDTVAPVPTLSLKSGTSPRKTNKFEVSVVFTENVTGLAKDDFTLSSGASATLSGSGKSYTLTVTCPDNTAQTGKATTVTLAANKCQDAAGNGNVAAAQTISVTYDTVPPAVASITSTTPQNFNASDAPMQVSIAFNEPVTNFTANALIHSITNGIVTPGSFTEAQDQKSFDLTITPTGDGVVSIFVPANACTDLAWNSNTVSTAISRTYDGTAPTVQTIAVDHTGYVSNAVLTATVTFSEAMNGVTADTLSVSQNAMAALVGSTDGTNYTFSVALNQDGPVTISVPGSAVPTDLAGNPLSGSKSFEETIVYDKTSPVVVLSSQPSNPTSVGDFAIKVSATEDNTAAGLALEWKLRDGNNDIVRSGSASAAPTNLWVAAGSGLPAGTYDFMAIVTDAAGNVGTATCQWTVTRDKPAVTITAPAQQPVKGDKATFTVTFGEAVHDFVQNDLTVLGGTVVSGSFKSVAATAPSVAYEVQVQATQPGTMVGLAVAEHVCTNALGIGNAAAGPVTCEVDDSPPVIGALSVSPLRANPNITVTNSFDVTEEHLASVTISGVQPSAITTNSIGGGITHCTFETASTFTNFTIVATDTVGNETTTAVVSPLFVDNTAPTVTWSGLPAANSTNDASSVVAEIDTVSEDNVRVVWSLERGAESAVVVTNGEDWAVVGQTLLFNALDPGETYTFTWTSTDDVGNAKEESLTWTMAPLDPDAVVIVSGTPDGDSAVFTVTWQDSTYPFDASSFLLRVNNAETNDATIDWTADETNATVTVPLASYTAGAYIELTVPAGALGNRVDSNTARVSFTPAAGPVLTYIGRSFTNDAEVVWTLENVDGDPTAFLSASTNDIPVPLEISARSNGPSNWIVSVCETWVPTVAATNESWNTVASSYKNIRLDYTNAVGDVLASNIGVAEANVARAVYGGDVFLKLWNSSDGTVTNYVTKDSHGNTIQPPSIPKKFAYSDYKRVANGVFETDRMREWVGNPIPFTENNTNQMAAVITSDEVLLLRALNGGDNNNANQWGETVFHSFQWQTTVSGSLINQQWEATQVCISVTDAAGTTTYWSVTTNAADVLVGNNIYCMPIPDIKGRAVSLRVITSTKRYNNDFYIASIAEAAAMGTPVKVYESPTPTATLDCTVTDDNRLHFHVDFDKPVSTNSYDVSMLSVIGLDGVAQFELSNATDRSCDIAVSGLSRDGDFELTIGEGFAKTFKNVWCASGNTPTEIEGLPSNEASFTFAVDCAPPTAAFTGSSETDGICTFTLAASEDVTGIGTNGMALVTNPNATVQAEIIGLERAGTNYTATVRATRWTGGDTLALRFAGVLRDLAGNTNAVDATSATVTFEDPTSSTVPSVTIAAGANGSVSPLGTVAAVDGNVTNVVATPDAGYKFTGWTGATPASATTNAATGSVTANFTGLANGTTIRANFGTVDSVSVTVTVSGSGGKASWVGTITLPKGSSTNVVFTAENGYWIQSVKKGNTNVSDAARKSSYTLQLNSLQADVTVVTATFEKKPNAIPITVKEDNAPTLSTNVTYNADWEHVFTAQPDKRIASLKVNGTAQPAAVGATTYTLQLFGVITNTEVIVTYEAKPVYWTVSFDANGHGTAPAAQTVEDGATASDPGELTAEGYTFNGWTLNGNAYDFSTPVTSDITLVAAWEEAETNEFTMTGFAWTAFDPATGTLGFTATTMTGTAPETITLKYLPTLDATETRSVPDCTFSVTGNSGTVTLPAGTLDNKSSFFATGVAWE